MLAVITPERPDTADARALISELDAHLTALYPRESRHGYAVDKLIAHAVAFFLLRHDGAPAACGGIQLFGAEYGEVKRMYVRPQFRGLGLGKLMLDRLAEHARTHGVTVLRLETGIHQTAAIGLYERAGFRRIPPFGEYTDDPLSVCFEKELRMEKNLVARAAVNIDAPRDKVWSALVSAEAIKHYMFGAQVVSDWREGSPIVWRGEWQGKAYEDKGVILQLTPGRTLRYSHFSPLSGLPDRPESYHTVSIELSAEGNQTQVTLAQDKNATDEARAHSEKNWATMLAAMKKFLEQ